MQAPPMIAGLYRYVRDGKVSDRWVTPDWEPRGGSATRWIEMLATDAPIPDPARPSGTRIVLRRRCYVGGGVRAGPFSPPRPPRS